MSVGEMIYNRRTELSLTLEEVGNYVGVSKSTVKKWETNYIASMKADKIAKLSEILQLKPTDFITGGYNNPSDYPQNILPVNTQNLSDMVAIPVIGVAAAGLSCYADENIESYEYVSKAVLSANDSYAYLRVKGDSMLPLIMGGDLVLIRLQTSVDSGEIAVVIIDDEDGIVKRVVYGSGWLELNSENKSYNPRRFEGRDVDRVRIFGRVMEVKRKF